MNLKIKPLLDQQKTLESRLISGEILSKQSAEQMFTGILVTKLE
jgi:hypothetical protein